MFKVKNIESKHGNPVVNQFKITTDEGSYFYSYETMICYVSNDTDEIIFDVDWSISRTTLKYLNLFLAEMRVTGILTPLQNGSLMDIPHIKIVDMNPEKKRNRHD